MRITPTSRAWLLGKCLLAIAFFVSVAYLVTTIGEPPTTGSIEFEFRKLLLQFIIVVAVGAVIKYIVEDANEARDEAREKRKRSNAAIADELKSLSDRLGDVYRTVKDERLRLGLRIPTDLTRPEYTDRMMAIRECQRKLEEMQDEASHIEPRLVQVLTPDTVQSGTTLRQYLMKMEDYLGTLTDEWRDIAPLWRDGPAPRDLERVRAFVARSGEHAADFALFDGYFHTAERLLAQYSNAATSN